MKLLIYILILTIFCFSSCSYLPENETYSSNGINYHETTEYIQLSLENNSSNEALIFLPGGLVDPHSYISIMLDIVHEGTTVIILKFSANLAILETSKPLRIIDQFPEINSWYICGHSLGGVAAQSVINKRPETFNGLILLGVYPSGAYSINNWSQNVLSIYAENDQISTIEEVAANTEFLPLAVNIDSITEMEILPTSNPITIYYLIQGGNHSQFGNYGFQNGDGVSTISTEEQHSQVGLAINTFIQWNESN